MRQLASISATAVVAEVYQFCVRVLSSSYAHGTYQSVKLGLSPGYPAVCRSSCVSLQLVAAPR